MQREAILAALRSVRTHPTAGSVFRMVRRKVPSVSFGTVYRNLNLLKDEGRVLELAFGKECSRYDGDVSYHHHFFCLKCEGVFDLKAPSLKDLDKTVSAGSGMDVRYHRINFYGRCKKCK